MSQKYWWVIVAILILVVAGVWMVKLGSTLPSGEEEVPAADGDTTSEINEELQGMNIGDLEGEFQAVDEELQGL